ncbi:MAG: hypothetical protein H6Q60_1416 [Oscillospiraceae bacterium]|nr:hypothetical protein [Oscillospiraceae bacterium]
MAEETFTTTEQVTSETKAAREAAAAFTSARLSQSKQFTEMEQLVLSVVLDSTKTYTVAEAKEAMREFLNKEVF